MNWKVILIAGVILRVIYFIIIPPGQSPDEVFILKRVWRNIQNSSTLIYPDSSDLYYPNNEYYNPPLYFVSAAVVARVFNFKPGNFVSYNAWFRSTTLLLRFFSLIMSLVSLVVIWRILKFLISDKSLTLGIFGFIATLPSLAVFSISANQNNLIFLLVTMSIYYILKHINSSKTSVDVVLGLLLGLLFLTKFDAVLVLPFYVYYLYKNKSRKKQFTKSVVIISLASFLVGGWWYVGEIVKYGWFYNQRLLMSAMSGYLKPYTFSNYADIVTIETYRSFFSTFGVFNNFKLGLSVYFISLLLTLVSCVGLFLVCYKRNLTKIKPIWWAFAASAGSNFILFIYMNFRYEYQPQGRYFFVSIIFLALLWVLGLLIMTPAKLRVYLPLGIVAFFLFLNVLMFNCSVKFYGKQSPLVMPSLCEGRNFNITNLGPD